MSDRRFSGGCFDCCLGGHNRRVNKSDYTVRGRLGVRPESEGSEESRSWVNRICGRG